MSWPATQRLWKSVSSSADFRFLWGPGLTDTSSKSPISPWPCVRVAVPRFVTRDQTRNPPSSGSRRRKNAAGALPAKTRNSRDKCAWSA